MNKKASSIQKVVAKLDDAITAFREMQVERPQDTDAIEARIAVLEWLKTGESGELTVDTPNE